MTPSRPRAEPGIGIWPRPLSTPSSSRASARRPMDHLIRSDAALPSPSDGIARRANLFESAYSPQQLHHLRSRRGITSARGAGRRVAIRCGVQLIRTAVKPGYIADAPGSNARSLPPTKAWARRHVYVGSVTRVVNVAWSLGYLMSYEHMGRMHGECVSKKAAASAAVVHSTLIGGCQFRNRTSHG